jgi:hypothetical protein
MITAKSPVIQIKDPLCLTVYDAREVDIVRDEDDQIIKITLPVIGAIKLRDRICIGPNKHPYRINEISERMGHDSPVYDLKIATRTKASLFLLPMLPGPKKVYFYDSLLLNCFIGTEEQSNCIALLYRFSGAREFLELESALKGLTIFKSSIDVSPRTVMYVFEVPNKHRDDYKLFLLGKYSKISERYKNRILEFHIMSKTGVIGEILYKSEIRRKEIEERIGEELLDDDELYSIPEDKFEVYKKEIYDL